MIIEIGVIILCVVVSMAVIFAIPAIIELRRAVAQASEFMKTTEKDLSATLRETEETLRSIRGITDKVNQVTGDVTSISGGLSGAAHDLRETTRHLERLVVRLSRHFSGVRAAMSAAMGVLINNLRGERK